MRLVTFDKAGRPVSRVRKEETVVDLSIAAPDLPGDWPAIFAAGALDRVAEAVAGAGPEGMRFYTKLKTITSRWPTGIRAGAEFVLPTLG